MSNWIITGGSVIGTSHSSQGEEKQDSVSVVDDQKGNVSFCLSDGAGSSKYSELSSNITAKFMADALAKLPGMIEKKGTGSWINDYIIQCIIDLRSTLYEEFSTYDLRDYHCTLVSGILFKDTCLVAHIGDGAVLSGTSVVEDKCSVFNEKLHLSEPENGEYKNETFFLTEPNWLKHLRIKVIPNVSWLIAGTDGGIDLLSLGDRLNDDLVSEFLVDLINCSPANLNQQINDMMSSTKADERTNDDKSLVIIISEEVAQTERHVWGQDDDTLKVFYPELQKKSSDPGGQQKPNPIISTVSKDSSGDVIGKTPLVIRFYNLVIRFYNFFHRRTILTVSLLLTSVICLSVLYNVLMPDTNNEQTTVTTSETEPPTSQPITIEREDTPEEASLPKDNEPDDETNNETNVVETTQTDTTETDTLENNSILVDPSVTDGSESSNVSQTDLTVEAGDDGQKPPVTDPPEVPNGVSYTNQPASE